MANQFLTNYTETTFLDKIKDNLRHCKSFDFSVSFIKKAGLVLLYKDIEAAVERGCKGRIITSTYQNFTDIESLKSFYSLMGRDPNFQCHLDYESFHDTGYATLGYHSKGYLFEFDDHRELVIGSSNITRYALLKNIEWDVSVVDSFEPGVYDEALKEFEEKWEATELLNAELINKYATKLNFAIERWDMDYDLSASKIKPNYMQKKALKELNRYRAVGVNRALTIASAGSGKTYLAAFDALNFNPRRLLYIVHEGSILKKSLETFQEVFGKNVSYGIYSGTSKESDADFVFATNRTMCNTLELFSKNEFDYIIIDECHRSQFGENHKAIKNFFPKAQLFGFTGTPIFEENATYKQIDGTIGSYTTTKDIFEKELHAYTITHAIDDRNVLRFHIDYLGVSGDEQASKMNETQRKKAIIEKILSKHDAVTNNRRYNAILATASINDAIEYYDLFKEAQQNCIDAADNEFMPLNIACVFSPPADGNKDVQQIQEDLPQEKEDNKKEPDKKKQALMGIIKEYNEQYGSSHDINNFDGYYQDIQQRIKDQKYSNTDYPHKNKIDITIVVDMLLTGFDSKYLNTLYVDKNLKYHGLIQAFSRTNRVLNDTKPYGNILDFRNQSDEVDKAIALFSGKDNSSRAKEIWLVDPAPKIVEKLDQAVKELETFMQSQGLECKPEEVSNLKGDAARCEFVNKFKEVQRLRTQLEQYTEIEEKDAEKIEELLPEDTLRAFRGAYIDVAQRLKAEQGKENEDKNPEVEQLDFEFVLFSSAIIDYDYIMALIAKYTQTEPKKQKISKEQLIGMLSATSNLLDEREDIIEYIDSLQVGVALDEKEIKAGYQKFREQKNNQEINIIAKKHDIEIQGLQAFIQEIIDRMIFDGEKLGDLLAPLDLSWRERTQKELDLMDDLIPLLKKLADGREIVGLNAYE